MTKDQSLLVVFLPIGVTNIELRLLYTQSAQPLQNDFIERFTRSRRTQVLDARIFNDLAAGREITLEWIEYYNNQRALKNVLDLFQQIPTKTPKTE